MTKPHSKIRKMFKERDLRIRTLKRKGFFLNWTAKKYGQIQFFLWPEMQVPPKWIQARTSILKKNAQILSVKIPRISFYVYPPRESVKELGFIPAVSFISRKEIHGHLNQSPGHELTHILLGQLNNWRSLPANGVFSEGICTYLDGTDTNRRRHAVSMRYNLKNKINLKKWYHHLPSQYYPLAGSLVQYLTEQYGWEKVHMFLKSLKGLRALSKTFREIFNTDLDTVEKEWRKWLLVIENKIGTEIIPCPNA